MAIQNLIWKEKKFTDLSTSELYNVLKVREDVFVLEQKCFYSDLDEKDQFAIHLFASDDKGVAAYLRVFPPEEGHFAIIGRVLTRFDKRGSGLGKAVVKKGIDFVKNNFTCMGIEISAQSHLKKFYNEFGFVAQGEDYLEDGIPHISMKLIF